MNPRARKRRAGAWEFLIPAAIVLASCQADSSRRVSVQVEKLSSAPAAPPDTAQIAACDFVEREAAKFGASLPRQLDADTAATRVVADGCHLTVEYQLLSLSARDIAPAGMTAMRERVADQLCTDAAARAALDGGGSFTNVYRDRALAPVGQFTVRAKDCGKPFKSGAGADATRTGLYGESLAAERPSAG